MSDLVIEGLRKSYGAFQAVASFDLKVDQGQFVSLVGPSGCGKTTILRMIAGLIEPDEGAIRVGGEDVTWKPVHKRDLGLVFQSYALFPHLSVFENVAFGLRRRKIGEPDIGIRVREALEMVRLAGLDERFPRQLSGGQQQRVALARALVTRPKLLLLDEPLSNLDALLRDEMRLELKRLQNELGVTTLFVTHDQSEALATSDRIVVLNAGRLEQFGTPEEIYDRPASTFVASFVGRSNFFVGTVEDSRDGTVTVLTETGQRMRAEPGDRPVPFPGERVRLAIRHERVRFAEAAPPGQDGLPAQVMVRAFAGSVSQYMLRLADGSEIQAEIPSEGMVARQGDRVIATWSPRDVIVLPEPAA